MFIEVVVIFCFGLVSMASNYPLHGYIFQHAQRNEKINYFLGLLLGRFFLTKFACNSSISYSSIPNDFLLITSFVLIVSGIYRLLRNEINLLPTYYGLSNEKSGLPKHASYFLYALFFAPYSYINDLISLLLSFTLLAWLSFNVENIPSFILSGSFASGYLFMLFILYFMTRNKDLFTSDLLKTNVRGQGVIFIAVGIVQLLLLFYRMF